MSTCSYFLILVSNLHCYYQQDDRAVQRCIWGIHNSVNLEVNWLQHCKDILNVPPPLWAKIRRMRYLTNERRRKKKTWNYKFQSHSILILGFWPQGCFGTICSPTVMERHGLLTPVCLFNTPTLRLFQTNLIILMLSLTFKRCKDYWSMVPLCMTLCQRKG